MCNKFGGHCHSSLGDIVFLSVSFKFSFRTRSKIEMVQKIYASRGGCEIHANKVFMGMASATGDFSSISFASKRAKFQLKK